MNETLQSHPFRPRQHAKQPPCAVACPNGTDIRGWIGFIAQRRKSGHSLDEAYARAWRTIVEVNPLPSVLGRVCPHLCEDACNRAQHDGSVSINAMERFLGDWALNARLPLPRIKRAAVQPDLSIGVVGAGPSGLSFAYQMARRGYAVTIYEQHANPGGMLRHGIPDYRLPPCILDAEIARILELGVDLKTHTTIGRDISIADLRARHAVVFLGIGAQRGRPLGVPGEEGPGVLAGTDYLRRVNAHEHVELGQRVVVIGGGNTAVDAARTARRMSAAVTLVYRRTRSEMPAIEGEVDEMLREGIRLELLAAPVKVERRDGCVSGIVLQRVELGEPDTSGRRRPRLVAGSDFTVPADTVIAAVAQTPDWDCLEQLQQPKSEWLHCDECGHVHEWLWAGGDVRAPGIAAQAIAHGRRAAETLHEQLTGGSLAVSDGKGVSSPVVKLDYYAPAARAHPRLLPVEEAVASLDAEVSAGITESQFLAEAARCLSCGLCFGCQQCWMYCMSGGFTPVSQPSPGSYFTLSLATCESCGKCVDICPCGYLEFDEAQVGVR